MNTYAYTQDGEVRRASATFFRGDSTNFHLSNTSFSQPDFIDRYVMKGWAPHEPFITRATPIVAFGSCYATNISNYLHNGGYNVLTKKENRAYITSMGDGIVNTSAILQQFEWAWLNKAPQSDVWHGYKAEEFGYDETIRRETCALFDEAELFIITLGLSEIWYDEPTGEVFWRAVPMDRYDADRHKFRVATHGETLVNLREIRALIRRFRPHANILFSVSPVPLNATFRPVSCLTADAVSKAVIRSALDEFLTENADDSRLHYMPSYEAVKRLFNNQWSVDRRHVYPHVLNFNMAMFEHYYCDPGIPYDRLDAVFRKALDEDIRIRMNGQVNDGHSYAEIRQRKIEAKHAAHRAERAATNLGDRSAAADSKKVEANARRVTRVSGLAAKAAIVLLALQGAWELSLDWPMLAWAIP